MKLNKENVKQESVVAIKQFIKGDTEYVFSCYHIEAHLKKVFKSSIDYTSYNLTYEVLESSPDAPLYDKLSSGKIDTEAPFYDADSIKGKELRNRFLTFAIENLESGKFDVSVVIETYSGILKWMTVNLILNPDYKGA